MRWARRIGRRERVKLAEERRDFSLRGGRPCLRQSTVVSPKNVSTVVSGHALLDQVGEAQWVLGLLGQLHDLVVVDTRQVRRGPAVSVSVAAVTMTMARGGEKTARVMRSVVLEDCPLGPERPQWSCGTSHGGIVGVVCA